MPSVHSIREFLDRFAPPSLAESWDNVGLLVGDDQRDASRVMTCLTITADVVAEAIDEQVKLIVSHHPLPFRPLQRLTRETSEGRYLLDLIAANVAIYSPHTAFDSAQHGINQRLAEGLQLQAIEPIIPSDEPLDDADPSEAVLGSGRHGNLQPAISLGELAERAKQFLQIEHLKVVGAKEQPISRVAVACGSAGEFLEPAAELGCECLITGETSFHTCLAAEASDVALLLVGHFASERFGVETLADVLGGEFSDVAVWASRRESNPIGWA